MRFTYQYRTSDNLAHSGEVSAPNRDAAFDILKGRGIKAYGMAEVPGFFNRLFGKGKRWIAIAILSTLVVAFACRAYVAWQGEREARISERHQIYGDPAFLAECEETAYANVFDDRGDRILAIYAQPGSAEGLDQRISGASSSDLSGCADRPVFFVDGERREMSEIKSIVAGMKLELKAYLADGVGTVAGYLKRLEERRREELAIYEKIATELAEEKDETVRESKNEALRAIGLRTVPKPKAAKKQRKNADQKK